MSTSERSPGVMSSAPSVSRSISRGTLIAATLIDGTARDSSSSEPSMREAFVAAATSRNVGWVSELVSGSSQTGTEALAVAACRASRSASFTRLRNAPTVGTPRSSSPSMAAVSAPTVCPEWWPAAVRTSSATAPRLEAICALRANSKALDAPR